MWWDSGCWQQTAHTYTILSIDIRNKCKQTKDEWLNDKCVEIENVNVEKRTEWENKGWRI